MSIRRNGALAAGEFPRLFVFMRPAGAPARFCGGKRGRGGGFFKIAPPESGVRQKGPLRPKEIAAPVFSARAAARGQETASPLGRPADRGGDFGAGRRQLGVPAAAPVRAKAGAGNDDVIS